ncbi:MAG TPA: homoserine O-acetyltransferase [Marinospirillum sp.]|uniref:homoserine O-succinyltransferase MetX n=1 Tax=Marinospirillum sp. TaxID=2183934 RepID=UPI002B461750|nr:homoserine O-acetyltransferase [Marinospirillum sp.]HKM15203.1 homoserine O-acetyltransferase [Marinospirillum sp.]
MTASSTGEVFPPTHSVGLVEPQVCQFNQPLHLASGSVLQDWQLMIETYGELNTDASNAVLICHALSGNHHAAGYHSEDDTKPGWWDAYIGPGKPIDTQHFFVVSLNNLGGCHGSTGPSSIDPATGQPFGPDFPVLTVSDWVDSQALLADRLGIQQWAAIVGGSLGGMQVLEWSLRYPQRLRHAVVVASSPKLSAQNIAFNEVARQAIMSDPEFCDGRYQEADVIPRHGVALARMVGHITYLSEHSMGEKFGRDLRTDKLNYGFGIDFEVESYLRYQGKSFSERFDANTYLLMTKALDYFDPAKTFDGDLVKALAPIQCRFLVVSFSTDWRFSPRHSEELVNALTAAQKRVSYARIKSPHGHDAFLIPDERYEAVFTAFMQRAAQEIKQGEAS